MALTNFWRVELVQNSGCLGRQATDDYDTDYTYDYNSDAELSADYSDSRISKSEDGDYDYSGNKSEDEENEEWWPEEVHLPNFTSVESEHSITKGGTVRITCSVDRSDTLLVTALMSFCESATQQTL